MWLLIAEAFIALALFVFIVWWTMSGRRRTDETSVKPAIPAVPAATQVVDASAAADPVAQPPGRDNM